MSSKRTILPRKRINDPLHGAVFLTRTEYKVATTPTFVRLANVKQLGLGAFVYPGAVYSRYEHSIGACHVAGQMLDAIEANSGKPISAKDRELTRIAALLHDLGHYPFSHATEEVVDDLEVPNILVGAGEEGADYFNDHEDLGHHLIRNDPHISRALEEAGIDPNDVVSRLEGGDESSLNLIVSSDLDCDRLDYLRRTALHAGLPYGGVDANYLIDNLTIDANNIPCLHSKSLGAADHFLVSRLYDFEQVPFHKAVVGYEEALKKTLGAMCRSGWIDLRKTAIEDMLAKDTWRRFDDQLVMGKIREFRDAAAHDGAWKEVLPYVDCILDRRAPKLVCSVEYMDQIDKDSDGRFAALRTEFEKIAAQVLSEVGIAGHLAFVWARAFRLLKGNESGQRVQILSNGDTATRSWPIDEAERTLCSKLEDCGRRHLRLYTCLNGFSDPKALRAKMRVRMGELYEEAHLDDIIRPAGTSQKSTGLVDAPYVPSRNTPTQGTRDK